MFAWVCAAFGMTAVLFAIWRSSRAPKALWASEEAAHATAAAKRPREGSSRREPRYLVERCGFAAVLGDPRPKTPCRIVNASRSGLRIACSLPFPNGAQVHAQWGDEFFIGTVCYSLAHGDEFLTGLQLLSCSYTRPPGFIRSTWSWHPLQTQPDTPLKIG